MKVIKFSPNFNGPKLGAHRAVLEFSDSELLDISLAFREQAQHSNSFEETKQAVFWAERFSYIRIDLLHEFERAVEKELKKE